jgi:hypothetical protein
MTEAYANRPERNAMDDFDTLTRAVLPHIREFLDRWDGFSPFGVALTRDGALALVAPYDAEADLDAPTMQRAVEDGLRQGAESGRYLAGLICLDARLPRADGGTDPAVLLHLERADGTTIDATIPYRRQADGTYAFDELVARDGQRRLF